MKIDAGTPRKVACNNNMNYTYDQSHSLLWNYHKREMLKEIVKFGKNICKLYANCRELKQSLIDGDDLNFPNIIKDYVGEMEEYERQFQKYCEVDDEYNIREWLDGPDCWLPLIRQILEGHRRA